jgi:hypothetical protein
LNVHNQTLELLLEGWQRHDTRFELDCPRYSPDLRLLSDRKKQKGHANRATVARKPVAYLMAADRGQKNLQLAATNDCMAL